ncbi:MAG: NADH-quinone oxidoreductase subunit NuoE [Rhodobacteraceae bacterium HLUCCA12]|nr:MAG: NADH-quinone oxidoreductase subunit NuoE [Rhodobacteraceae bacterium HLUCCA12]
MLRRLHHTQPESFAFTPANLEWAQAQITKYPEGRQASAIIPLLWRAQEQEGWLSRPAIEHVADMLGMAYIRALEVATFYFMFQLQPVGSVAHVQVCGTTSCMICGAEDLIGVCREKIAGQPHALSLDGKFSWEEVECLGACSNAPMVQIGKDYYEDLTADKLRWILDELAAGRVPTPGPQNGRYASEPASGLTSLKGDADESQNASVALAVEYGDTIKRIDGTEVPILTAWLGKKKPKKPDTSHKGVAPEPKPAAGLAVDETGSTEQEARAKTKAKPKAKSAASPVVEPAKVDNGDAFVPSEPARMDRPKGTADDLKKLKGVGPKLEKMLNELGFWHFHQIAAWTESEVAWVDDHLKFKGRIERDGWIEQAKILAAGGETEFSARKG